jgi:hypothetical protein
MITVKMLSRSEQTIQNLKQNMERFAAIPPSDGAIPGTIPPTYGARSTPALVLRIAIAAENPTPLLSLQLGRLLPNGHANRLHFFV